MRTNNKNFKILWDTWGGVSRSPRRRVVDTYTVFCVVHRSVTVPFLVLPLLTLVILPNCQFPFLYCRVSYVLLHLHHLLKCHQEISFLKHRQLVQSLVTTPFYSISVPFIRGYTACTKRFSINFFVLWNVSQARAITTSKLNSKSRTFSQYQQ